MPAGPTADNLIAIARDQGVVGAGGAGFPAYGKLRAKADIVIANGAECEPLLHKDKRLMEIYPDEVIAGLMLLQEATGADTAIIGIKAKNEAAIAAIQPQAESAGVSLELLDDIYPSGDEVDLVYGATGRQIPTGGIPLEVGVVVNNVETLLNLQRANRGEAVTHTLISVTGAVKSPKTFWAPVGTSYRDAIEYCGGATLDEIAVVDGGPMMGKVQFNLDEPITKTCGGLVILPRDHYLVGRKTQPESQYKRVGKSACDQCSLCTELCPRYLLGYPVQPHLVMRALEFSGPQSLDLGRWGQVCSECNICSLYACPENLNPRDMCRSAKVELDRNGSAWSRDELAALTNDAHPMREYRGVPTEQLKQRLGLTEWDFPAPFTDEAPEIQQVAIPLQQHIGEATQPTVQLGAAVSMGDVIGAMEGDELGAGVHASIDGIVVDINSRIVIKGQV
ncbi:MAG: SLBB domain-containing protein [Candidatus Marinimicrobia bacterium]|nr:SLBB domain-containing protein [Candidatus Neomarinimicrobiota bacterium]